MQSHDFVAGEHMLLLLYVPFPCMPSRYEPITTAPGKAVPWL